MTGVHMIEMYLVPFCKLTRTGYLKSAAKASTNSSNADSKRESSHGSDGHCTLGSLWGMIKLFYPSAVGLIFPEL